MTTCGNTREVEQSYLEVSVHMTVRPGCIEAFIPLLLPGAGREAMQPR
jgi:hypothetical protein